MFEYYTFYAVTENRDLVSGQHIVLEGLTRPSIRSAHSSEEMNTELEVYKTKTTHFSLQRGSCHQYCTGSRVDKKGG